MAGILALCGLRGRSRTKHFLSSAAIVPFRLLTPTSSSSSSSSSSVVAAAAGKVWRQFSFQAKHSSSISTEAAASAGGKEHEAAAAGRWELGAVDVSFPTYMVWGANTGVGKTLVAAGLSSAIVCQSGGGKSQGDTTIAGLRRRRDVDIKDVLYVKPVQTGFPSDSDARYVFNEVSRVARLRPQSIPHGLFVCNHTLQVSPAVQRTVRKTSVSTSSNSVWSVGDSSSAANGTGMTDFCSYESQLLQGVKTKNRPEVFLATDGETSNSPSRVDGDVHGGWERLSQSHFTCKTMWAWFDPVSPHLTAAKEGSAVPDLLVLDSLQGLLGNFSNAADEIGRQEDTSSSWTRKWAIVETAGGVASPGPSGTLQCDLYRPLRFPGVLVGDGKLGGISTTIGAYEMLLSGGYDIPVIVIVDSGLRNEEPLLQYLRHKIPVLVLPPLPQDPNKSLAEWFAIAEGTFAELRDVLESAHLKRLERLEEMPRKASQILWWPFTQHDLVAEESITLIDSRSGENFSVYKGGIDPKKEEIALQFDACASWWTQGPDATLQSELAKEAAHTAGRYGHVMFPENVHEPALRCAELLLQGVGRGWAERVFFSDNGATSIEVAIKMGFRKYINDHGLRESPISKHSEQQFKVLALKGSYHGDTLGALEAQAPSAYTGFLQQPWYSGRGLFLEPPTVFQRNGRWLLHLPEAYCSSSSSDLGWKSRNQLFDMCRDSTPLAKVYSMFIDQQLSSSAAREESSHIAALITEPVIHGAGGMQMLDPLFQRMLVHECRRRGIPVIFDEVLSGCWRLGVEEKPSKVCRCKVPSCGVLYVGTHTMRLLNPHHSQSASDLLGCTPDIACYSKLLTGGLVPLAATLATQPVFDAFRGDSKLDALLHGHSYTAHAIGCASAVVALQHFSDPSRNSNLMPDGHRLRELWSPQLVAEISSHRSVQRVVSLGTIFALELRASVSEAGYASMLSRRLVEDLRHGGIYTRPLGNVVYLMCGPLTQPETCTILLHKLLASLG